MDRLQLSGRVEGANIWFASDKESWVVADYPDTDEAMMVGRYPKNKFSMFEAIAQFKRDRENVSSAKFLVIKNDKEDATANIG
jgi:hypothetical protein